ncbi:MAG: hypothetical protein HGB14_09365 [Anaerolineaceae bacterium]|nr:hypothetical protein [Anaerolineaceae bacterium]
MIQKSFRRRKWFLPGIIFILVSFSCNLPFANSNQQISENNNGTVSPTNDENLQPTETQQSTSIPHTPEETNTPEPEVIQPTEMFADTQYRGFIGLKEQKFIAYDFQGVELGFSVSSGPESIYSDNEVSVLTDSIVYTGFTDAFRVYQVDQSGTRSLDFISVTDPISLSVSPDGTKIAWGTSTWIDNAPQTEIFVANMDGSNIHLVDKILASEQIDAWLVFHPIRWMSDGRLVYATGMTGIGGYLIFWGYNGIRIYDPQSDSIEILVNDNEMLGLCVSSISEDLSKVAIVCHDPERAVRVRDLNTKNEIRYEVLPDQNSAGSAQFSASGEWLAYVIQRQNPDDEYGFVVVVPTDGSIPPKVIAENPGGTFHVEGWIDEESFLVSGIDFERKSSIWRMNRDATDITRVTDGNFVGFLP